VPYSKPQPPNSNDRVVEFFLLGRLNYGSWQSFQRRLAYQASADVRNRLVVVCCEHSPVITVGRNGSQAHIRLTQEQLTRAELSVRWVNRGGGVVLHGPGQLAIYPIASLDGCGWSTAEFMRYFHDGLRATIESLGIRTVTRGDSTSIWTRRGLLVATGVAVADRTTTHGAFVNVNPEKSWQGFIDTAAGQSGGDRQTATSSLFAERRRAVRMTEVRSAVVEHLTYAFGCQRYEIHSAHPWLKNTTETSQEHAARVA
jgi:lipoyl(octanoyl) transferase